MSNVAVVTTLFTKAIVCAKGGFSGANMNKPVAPFKLKMRVYKSDLHDTLLFQKNDAMFSQRS